MKDRKPKRRWVRFSLRVFLLLLTIGCIWFGWIVHRAKQQRNVVEWVSEFDGEVTYEYEVEVVARSLNIKTKPPAPQWLVDRMGVDYFSTIHWIAFLESDVEDLSPIGSVKGLRQLGLDKTKVNDLRPLRQLTHLEILYVGGSPVNDISPISNLRNLRELHLERTDVADLAPLRNMANLQKLYIRNTKVGNLKPLYGLENLKEIHIDNAQINETKFEDLKRALPHAEVFYRRVK